MKFPFISKPHQEWILIRTNWLLQVSHKFVALLAVASVIMIAVYWKMLPPLVPLWYSRPWGSDQLAPPVFLFFLPISSVTIHLINLAFAMYVTTEYLVFTQSLFLSSLIVSLLSFIAVIKIIFLVV